MPLSGSFTTVRYYVNTDPYFYTVDNRPLTDLAANTTFLADTFDAGFTTITITLTGRLKQGQGVAVASANNLVLGSGGNRFQISGTTQINLLDNTSWTAGSIITLHFQGSLTVKHNQAASGNNKPIMLSGAVDFAATADDQLTLQYDGTAVKWYETARTVI